MIIKAPYSLTTNIKYEDHAQINRYVNSLGNGIVTSQAYIAHKQMLANAKNAEHIAKTISNEIENMSFEMCEAISNQTEVISDGFRGVQLKIQDGFESVNNRLYNIQSDIQTGFEQLNNTAKQSTIILAEALNNGFDAMISSFDMGMNNIVSHMEFQTETMKQGLKNISKLLENQNKTLAFERYKDAVREYENYLVNQELILLDDAYNYLQESLASFKGNPYVYFYLGNIYMIVDANKKYFDLDKAIENYSLAVLYSKSPDKRNNMRLAAMSAFNAAWASYANNNVKKAIEFAENSKEYSDHIAENRYNLAKFYAYQGKAEDSIKNLDFVIKKYDPNYTLKANIDSDFNIIKEERNRYFESLRDEKRKMYNDFMNKIK